MPYLRKAVITWDTINLKETDESGLSIGQVIDAQIEAAVTDNQTLHELTVAWETPGEWHDTVQQYHEHNGATRSNRDTSAIGKSTSIKRGKLDWKDIPTST